VSTRSPLKDKAVQHDAQAVKLMTCVRVCLGTASRREAFGNSIKMSSAQSNQSNGGIRFRCMGIHVHVSVQSLGEFIFPFLYWYHFDTAGYLHQSLCCRQPYLFPGGGL